MILNNKQVKSGVSAVGEMFSSKMRDGSSAIKNELYRPVAKLVYALEWSISENNPFVGHLFNVLLYACLCVLLYRLFTVLVPQSHFIPLLAALLFTIHPIHTEVVANIKSVDEILALFFFVCSLLLLYAYVQSNLKRNLLWSLLLFTAGLFSKESAVTFYLLIPLFIFYIHKQNKKELIRLSLYFFIPVLLFLIARNNVLGNYDHSKMIGKIDNFLISIDSPVKQFATSLYMLGHYIKLLFIPYPLVCDYSFNHFPVVSFGHVWVILSGLILLAAMIYVIRRLKTKSIEVFGIFWFIMTILIASNLFYLIGTNFGERLLFAPSVGFCLCIAPVLVGRAKTHDKIPHTLKQFFENGKVRFIFIMVVLIVFVVISVTRNSDWKSNLTLAGSDVSKNPQSARLHLFFANELRNEIVEQNNSAKIQEQNLPKIKDQLETAIKIYPEYGSAHFAMGEYFMHTNDKIKALEQFKTALYYLPKSLKVYVAISNCMTRLNYPDSALVYANRGLQMAPGNPELIAKLGEAWLKKQKPDSAIYCLNQVFESNPKNNWVCEKLAEAYFLKKDSVNGNYYKSLLIK